MQPIYRQVPGVGVSALKMVAKPHRKIVMDLYLFIFVLFMDNYSDERVLCSASQTCLANCMYKKQNLREILSIGALRT